jgi:hypothetical protein
MIFLHTPWGTNELIFYVHSKRQIFVSMCNRTGSGVLHGQRPEFKAQHDYGWSKLALFCPFRAHLLVPQWHLMDGSRNMNSPFQQWTTTLLKQINTSQPWSWYLGSVCIRVDTQCAIPHPAIMSDLIFRYMDRIQNPLCTQFFCDTQTTIRTSPDNFDLSASGKLRFFRIVVLRFTSELQELERNPECSLCEVYRNTSTHYLGIATK